SRRASVNGEKKQPRRVLKVAPGTPAEMLGPLRLTLSRTGPLPSVALGATVRRPLRPRRRVGQRMRQKPRFFGIRSNQYISVHFTAQVRRLYRGKRRESRILWGEAPDGVGGDPGDPGVTRRGHFFIFCGRRRKHTLEEDKEDKEDPFLRIDFFQPATGSSPIGYFT